MRAMFFLLISYCALFSAQILSFVCISSCMRSWVLLRISLIMSTMIKIMVYTA